MDDRELTPEAMRHLRETLKEPRTAQVLAREAKLEAARKAETDKAVNQTLERLLGVRPEHSDAIYTQHPVMAGVLRTALREVYALAQANVLLEMLTRPKDGPG